MFGFHLDSLQKMFCPCQQSRRFQTNCIHLITFALLLISHWISEERLSDSGPSQIQSTIHPRNSLSISLSRSSMGILSGILSEQTMENMIRANHGKYEFL